MNLSRFNILLGTLVLLSSFFGFTLANIRETGSLTILVIPQYPKEIPSNSLIFPEKGRKKFSSVNKIYLNEVNGATGMSVFLLSENRKANTKVISISDIAAGKYRAELKIQDKINAVTCNNNQHFNFFTIFPRQSTFCIVYVEPAQQKTSSVQEKLSSKKPGVNVKEETVAITSKEIFPLPSAMLLKEGVKGLVILKNETQQEVSMKSSFGNVSLVPGEIAEFELPKGEYEISISGVKKGDIIKVGDVIVQPNYFSVSLTGASTSISISPSS